MLRSGVILLRSMRSRGFCTPSSNTEKIVASVIFERLPLVLPKIDPSFYAFQLFTYRWGGMAVKKTKTGRRTKKLEQEQPVQALEIPESVAKGDLELEFKRIPWSSKADESNNKRSLMRALDKRLYLVLYGSRYGSVDKPVWHFPEKVYESERTLRQCAEFALKGTIGDLSHANFVGNIPIGHLVQKEDTSDIGPFKQFFFKSHVLGLNKFTIENCQDFVWVTKDEIVEYFPEQADFFKKMIIG